MAGESITILLNPSPVEPFQGVPNWKAGDVITLNNQEAMELLGSEQPSAAELAQMTGIPTVVLTLGGDGAEVLYRKELTRVPAPHTLVIDTTGAGDSFSDALAAGLDRGLDFLDAARLACKCAAFSVGRCFCIPSFPRIEDLA